ncbi:cytochrome ubiquinol oxidase subunit I [Desulfomicrobium escambiense]|uniref:cytochrome ubiquinol oxidase subunit I n=1 Tax=Desulfomicrobium escambiense TaxID=29503 RepID=UPI000426F854|nr:cytochrome ubiquinol oxidase subunit I [Desulfomicrobium escambiense]
MNFPIWDLQWAGGGLLIAMISVFHVYIAHFAVGGGLFLVLTELLAYRRQSPEILAYAKRHTRFFLLVTMVLGGITGVGIWFIISLVAPAATSSLIHTFVFGWAIEWVFFLGEIVSLLIYYYTFGRMGRRNHLAMGWIYFFFGWMSLFMINGIIGFMLTPGDWPATRSFWDGFFNPTFWPALAFRTFIAVMFAGLYGFVTATWEKDAPTREAMVRYSALWLLLPFALLLLSGWWYIQVLPAGPKAMILGANPEIVPFLEGFVQISAILFVGGLIMAIKMPATVKRPMAVALLVVGLMYMGCFEWMREAGRRPYLIHGHMYSNAILAGTEDAIAAQGFLATSGWNRYQEVTPENAVEAGREIFRGQCSSCHSIGGPLNDIKPLTAAFDQFGMESMIRGMGTVHAYMPRFAGTAREREALASFIVQKLNSRTPAADPPAPPALAGPEIPPFDAENGEYVLLAWCTLGEKCISDCDAHFSFLPPGSVLTAQLVRRDPRPEIVTQGVKISYIPPAGFENPSKHVDFWKYAPSLVGKELPENVSAKGLGLSGDMKLNEKNLTFVADGIPVLPYTDDGGVNPYPVFTIEARDAASGELLATTRVVAPVSTEIGCKHCHGGEWRRDDVTGISAATASDVLARHDRRHKTDLQAQAASGRPVLCQSCHPDPLLNAAGRPELLNLPTAIHGFHANYMTGMEGAQACRACHPESFTRCARGVHATQAGLTCVNCHGTMEDHALSLLKAEKEAGKAKAERLMRHVRPRLVATVDEIVPRQPWKDEPECLTCHVDFAPPQGDQAFNQWVRGPEGLYRTRTDDAGLMCEACHGPTHAEYPAVNPFHPDLDAIQPLQYQGAPGPIGSGGNCAVCHTEEMLDEFHHPNILGGN